MAADTTPRPCCFTPDAMASDGSLLSAALAYAAHGWAVFPCAPRGGIDDKGKPVGPKRPLVERGFHAATCDERQIRAWWARWPDALIATPTVRAINHWVLDIDVHKGAKGLESLAAWEARHGALPDTAMVITASGGRHVYFAYPPDREVVTLADLAPGIDTRGAGGYVIVPPSVSEVGTWQWGATGDSADGVAIAPAPSWLLDLVCGAKPTATATRTPAQPDTDRSGTLSTGTQGDPGDTGTGGGQCRAPAAAARYPDWEGLAAGTRADVQVPAVANPRVELLEGMHARFLSHAGAQRALAIVAPDAVERAGLILAAEVTEAATRGLAWVISDIERRASPVPMAGVCRVCGCTDARACPGGCAWGAPDLCSACAPVAWPAPAHQAETLLDIARRLAAAASDLLQAWDPDEERADDTSRAAWDAIVAWERWDLALQGQHDLDLNQPRQPL